MEDATPTSARVSAGPAGLSAVPLFHAAWLFAAGIAATQALWIVPGQLLVAVGAAGVLCGLAALRAQRVAWLPLALLWLLLGAWCAEMEPHPAPSPMLAALSDNLLRTVEGTVVDAGPVRSEDELSVDEPVAAAPAQRIDLRVSTLEVVTDAEDAQEPVNGGVRLTVRWPAKLSNAQAFRCGERIRAVVRLLPPETYHDPGVWSRAEFLLDQGITSSATVSIDRVDRLGLAPGRFMACRVSGLQHASSARLLALPAAMRRLPAVLRPSQDDAIMLAAMVTGDRTYLSHSLRVGFERTGSFHMLVVSGFHLAIVAGCILWTARRLRVPRVPATLLTIAASFAYALFTGFATPVQRSLWMVTLYLIGRLVYRERSPMNTIGFAALCLLAASPRSLFESSLQMTLLAVVAIAGVAAPLLQGTIHPYLAATRDLQLVALDVKLEPKLAQFRVMLRMVASHLQTAIHPWRGDSRAAQLNAVDDGQHPQLALFRATVGLFPALFQSAVRGRFADSIAWGLFPWAVRFLLRVGEMLAVTCVVELAMALPMAIYFHRITVFALPVNLFILPLLAVLMPAALLTLIALFVWPPAAVVPAMLAAALLHSGVKLVNLFGSLAFGDFRIPAPLMWQSAVFCVLLGAAIVLAHRALSIASPWQRRAAWAALLLGALVAVAPRPVQHPRDALLFEVIDVGQGDSLLLITPEGKTLLVDGGGFGGGARQAPQEFDIGEEVVSQALWSRGIRRLDVVALSHAHSDHMGGLPAVLRNFRPAELWVGKNPRFGAYNALLDEAAALDVRVRTLRAGDSLQLGSARIAVLAPLSGYQPGAEPANNDSLVMRAAYGGTSVLLEGDAEAPIEEAMLAEQGLGSTLLKVGHHGSITSTRPEFLARVAPRWAAISCGLHNRYGHPRDEVLDELQAAGVRTFRTDLNGALCFRLDGKTVVPEESCGGKQSP
jgi:competence protein ComEC